MRGNNWLRFGFKGSATLHIPAQILIWEIEFTYSKPRHDLSRIKCNELKPIQHQHDPPRQDKKESLNISDWDDEEDETREWWCVGTLPQPGPGQDTLEMIVTPVSSWPGPSVGDRGYTSSSRDYSPQTKLGHHQAGSLKMRHRSLRDWRVSGDLYRSISRYRKCGNLPEPGSNRWLVEGGDTEDRERERDSWWTLNNSSGGGPGLRGLHSSRFPRTEISPVPDNCHGWEPDHQSTDWVWSGSGKHLETSSLATEFVVSAWQLTTT